MPKLVRRIDLTPASEVSAATLASTDNPAPPALASIPVPQDLALTSVLGRSAVTPTALVRATWEPPLGVEPQGYALQISEDSSFPTGSVVTIGDIRQPSTTIEGLKTNTTYYVRVAAVYRGVQSDWTEVTSTNGVDMITTPADTAPASTPTGAAATFINAGDLLITWTNPTEANFRVVEIRIYSDSGKTTHYHTAQSATGAYIFTAAQNGAATGYLYDNSLYVELFSLTYGGVYSSTAATASATKALPATPGTIVHSWSGDSLDAGTAGPDWTISWAVVSDASRYVLTIDGKSFALVGTRFTYNLDANRADHTGTADPVLSYSLVAYDALNQASASAATGTATNHNPPTTAVTLTAGFSAVAISATPSAAADLRDYTFRIIKDGSTLATYRSSSPDQIYKATVRGSYQVGVTVTDIYGQASTETISSAVVLDALTTEELRSAAIYTDSDGNTSFDSLKDGITASGGITYAASAGWRWTQIERPLLDRYKTVTVALSSSASIYIGYSKDGITWTWYYGGTTSAGQWLPGSSTATEATAQAGAVGVSAGTFRIDLANLTEARYILLGHRHPTVAYTLREFYARRLTQTDDLEVECVRAINIAAATITADKMSVLQLSAITADMGSITAGTITGATIQTATSGARVVLSSDTNGGAIGYGGSDTYSPSSGSGTYQVLWKKTDGKVYAGGGVVILDSNGVTVTGDTFSYSLTNISPVTVTRANAIEWTVGSGQRPSISGSSSNGQLLARGQRITLAIPLGGSNTANYGLDLQSSGAHRLTTTSFLFADADATAATAFKVTAAVLASGCAIESEGATYLKGPANFGSATAATTNGQVAVQYSDTSATSVPTVLYLEHTSSIGAGDGFGADLRMRLKSSTTVGREAGLIRTGWGTAADATRKAQMEFYVYDTSPREGFRLAASGSAPMIGFLGAAAVARQTGGALTADNTYNATERDMINAMWTALQAYGLLT